MKLTQAICLSVLTLSCSQVALADIDVGPYVGVHGGIAVPSGTDSGQLNTGPVVGAEGGYRIGNIRVEGALDFYSNSLDANSKEALRMTTVMGNVYYDFKFGAVVVPFVGAGVGWLHSWLTDESYRITRPEDNEFAYQVMAGMNFTVTQRTDIGVDYRHLGWTDGNGSENIFEASVNYSF